MLSTSPSPVIYTGAWNDPVKERAAAMALIDQGADVIGQHVDSPTPQIVAQERGVYGTGHHRDLRQFATWLRGLHSRDLLQANHADLLGYLASRFQSRARASSTRFWRPYGSLPTGTFRIDSISRKSMISSTLRRCATDIRAS